MSYSEAFSSNYITARERFRAASSSLGYQHTAYPIDLVSPTGEELTIDVAIAGSPNPRRTVVFSSGLHGVEGYLGSAIQLALLEENQPLASLSSDIKIVLIHALFLTEPYCLKIYVLLQNSVYFRMQKPKKFSVIRKGKPYLLYLN